MHKVMTLTWHNGRSEQFAVIRAGLNDLIAMARHTVAVHGMESQTVALSIYGTTWEGTVEDDSDMVQFIAGKFQ
jgi:predicted YcjX-like family ATPase